MAVIVYSFMRICNRDDCDSLNFRLFLQIIERAEPVMLTELSDYMGINHGCF